MIDLAINTKPKWFTHGQGIYNPDGTLLGHVTSISVNYNGFLGLERAKLKTPDDGTRFVISDQLRSGNIVTRTGLRKLNVGRKSPGPRFFGMGARIFRGELYIGCVQTLGDTFTKTNYNQYVTPDGLKLGTVTHGSGIRTYGTKRT